MEQTEQESFTKLDSITVTAYVQSNDAPVWSVITATVTVVVMVTIGVPGNILIILVYGKRRHQQTAVAAPLFITALAVVDCFTCAVLIPSLPFIIRHNADPGYVSFWWCASVAVVMYSVWLLVAIATDHYCAICHPLKLPMTSLSVQLILLTGLLWSLFMAALIRIGRVPAVKQAFKFDIFRWASGLYLMICFATLAVLYIRMFCFLHKRGRVGVLPAMAADTSGQQGTSSLPSEQQINLNSNPASRSKPPQASTSSKMRQTMNSAKRAEISSEMSSSGGQRKLNSSQSSKTSNTRSSEQIFTVMPSSRSQVAIQATVQAIQRVRQSVTKMAKMLAVVTIVFIISYIPSYILPAVIEGDNQFTYVFSYFINHAANPFIYSFMNKRFRRDVRKLFTHRRTVDVIL